MRIAIHQPNFCPWFPYFEKIQAADKFVILRHCQYEKGGYQNRFNIGDQWYTMPVASGLEPIDQKKYIEPVSNWRKLKARLPQYEKILDKFDWCISESLLATNVGIILTISGILGLRTSYFMDQPTDLTSTDRLVEICRQHGATTYLAGPSGGKYMDFQKFDSAGIKVEFHENKIKRPILEFLNEII